MQLGIIGTGKLGGPVSEALAESAAQVHAYDILVVKISLRHLRVVLESIMTPLKK